MPIYSTQYNPYTDLAQAVQGPAASLSRMFAELPRERAQARALDSEMQVNNARIGLMGEQGRTEQAQQGTLRAQAGSYDAKTELDRLTKGVTEQMLSIAGQGMRDISQGLDTPAARAVFSLDAASNVLSGKPGHEGIASNVSLMRAGSDPVAQMNVLNKGAGVPFNRAVSSAQTTPITLGEGAAMFNPMAPGQVEAPAPVYSNPRTFNPQSSSSVDAARLRGLSSLWERYMSGVAEGVQDPAVLEDTLQKALAGFGGAAGALTPAPLSTGTNAPAVRRYNPATGRLE